MKKYLRDFYFHQNKKDRFELQKQNGLQQINYQLFF